MEQPQEYTNMKNLNDKMIKSEKENLFIPIKFMPNGGTSKNENK